MIIQIVEDLKDSDLRDKPNIKTVEGSAVCSWSTCSINHTAGKTVTKELDSVTVS